MKIRSSGGVSCFAVERIVLAGLAGLQLSFVFITVQFIMKRSVFNDRFDNKICCNDNART